MSEGKKRWVDFHSPERNLKPLENKRLINWDLCFMCQISSKETLQFPAANARLNVSSKESYDNLA